MTPQRVALMRDVRRLLRAGVTQQQAALTTGASWREVRFQKHLLAIANGSDIDTRTEPMIRKRRVTGGWKASAESNGDLCDIMAARASRADLRYWGERA